MVLDILVNWIADHYKLLTLHFSCFRPFSVGDLLAFEPRSTASDGSVTARVMITVE